MDLKDLKKSENLNQRKKWQITILAKDYFKKQGRYRQFEIINKDKP